MTNTVVTTALKTIASTPEAAQTAPVSQTVEATSGWLAQLTTWVKTIDDGVWGVPLIAAILVTGLLLTFILRLRHVFNLKNAFRIMFAGEEPGDAKGEVSQVSQVRFLRLSTCGLGVFSVGVALAVMNVTSVMTTWWALQSVLSGGMLGLFLLGAFARRTRPAQAAVATVIGVLAVFWVVFGEKLFGLPHLLHVNLAMVVGTLSLVIVGFFLATFMKGQE